MSRPSLNEFLCATEGLFNVCSKNIPIREGQDQTSLQIIIFSIYLTTIELSSGVLAAIKQGQYVCSAALLRSLMEYYVEFLYVLKDPSIIEKLEDTAGKEQKTLINAIKYSKSDYFNETRNKPEFAERVDEVNMAMKDKKKLGIEYRFEKVGLGDDYIYYRCLTTDAHPNFSRYSKRYLEMNTDGVMEYNHQYTFNRDESEMQICRLADILVNSTIKAHEFFPDGDPKVIQKKLEVFLEIFRHNNSTGRN